MSKFKLDVKAVKLTHPADQFHQEPTKKVYTDTIPSDGFLQSDETIFSKNGKYELIMQRDGNLVLYRRSDNYPLWATNTNGSGAVRANMKSDGNFVLWTKGILPHFHASGVPGAKEISVSNTAHHAGSVLKLQDDGNLEIYQDKTLIWTSNSWQTLAKQMIQDKYNQIGGQSSQLGRPIEPDRTINQDGNTFFMDFNGGIIKFTSKDGVSAYVTRKAVIKFKGIHCFEKEEGSDEPYVLIAVYASDSKEPITAQKFPIGRDNYENFVRSTDSAEAVVISPNETTWAPQSFIIICTVMEADSGDPDKIVSEFKKATELIAAKVGFGAEASAVLELLDELGILSWGFKFLGMGDDHIDTQPLEIKLNQLKPMKPIEQFQRISYNYESQMLSDGNASYKLYFEIYVEDISITIE